MYFVDKKLFINLLIKKLIKKLTCIDLKKKKKKVNYNLDLFLF